MHVPLSHRDFLGCGEKVSWSFDWGGHQTNVHVWWKLSRLVFLWSESLWWLVPSWELGKHFCVGAHDACSTDCPWWPRLSFCYRLISIVSIRCRLSVNNELLITSPKLMDVLSHNFIGMILGYPMSKEERRHRSRNDTIKYHTWPRISHGKVSKIQ